MTTERMMVGDEGVDTACRLGGRGVVGGRWRHRYSLLPFGGDDTAVGDSGAPREPGDGSSTVDANDARSQDAGTAFDCLSGATGMVAYFPFDEGEGGIAGDCSGSGLSGYLQGDGSVPTWIPGHRGSGLAFSSAARHQVFLGTPTSLNTSGALTVSAWVRATNASLTMGIVAKASSWQLFTQDGSAVLAIITGSGNRYPGASSAVLPNNTWVNVAAVFRPGKAVEVYLDGNVQVAATDAGTRPPGGSVTIGSVNDQFFDGAIDEVRLFNRALAASEISELAAQ